MTVYLDVIWLLNFLFDSLLLYLTALFLKRSIRIWRLLAGGFIGSLIIILTFSPLNGIAGSPMAKFMCSVFMILAVFGYRRLRYFFKGLMTLYLVTFLLGGSLIGIHYFIQNNPFLTTKALSASVQGFGDPISWLFVLVGFPIVWHFSKRNIENLEMTKIQYEQIVTVTITINDEEFVYKGLVDSGNQLYDPLSKMPVMFVSIKKNYSEMPAAIQRLALDSESVIMGNADIPVEWENRLRIIPCRVVGQEHQLIAAVKPDKIQIKKEDGEFICEKGLISYTMQQLSSDDEFQCIVHPKMLTGTRKNDDSEKVS